MTFAALLSGVCGCATDGFKSGSGDVGQLILERAVAFGAKPVSTNAVFRVTSHWRFFKDDNGIVIRMPPSEYGALESFLIETFGMPLKGPEDTPDGGKYGIYKFANKAGATLQFGRDSVDGSHVEIIRPLTDTEAAESFTKAVQDKKVQRALSTSPSP